MSEITRRGLLAGAMAAHVAGPSLAEGDGRGNWDLPASGGGENGLGRLFTAPGGGAGRRNHESRRLEFERRASDERGSLVFAGDSITQMFSSLERHLPGGRVANRGINGDTSGGLLQRLQADVLALAPRGMVVLIGSNDLVMGVTPDRVGSNIHGIVLASLAAPSAPALVLCTIMPRGPATPDLIARIRAANQHIASIGRHYRGVEVCDSWRALAGPSGAPRPEDFPDGVHPSPIGYARWMGVLKPILRRRKLALAADAQFLRQT